MRREHIIESGEDSSLRFWFKGEQNRLIDEISGNPIIINQNLMVWDSGMQAYRFNKPSSYNPKYSAYCECDTGMDKLVMTVVADIYPYSSGKNIVTLDTWPTRQAMFGVGYNNLTRNTWNRVAFFFERPTSTTIHYYIYLNGVKIRDDAPATSDGTFNRYQGVTLNFVNQWSNDWGVYFGKNFRWYNRVLTLEEVAAL